VTLRSKRWFDDPAQAGLTALYLERYLNYGLTREELQSGRPIIGIAQTGSDLVPCNRHHLQLAQRVKEGIRDAGGIGLEFPVHPLQLCDGLNCVIVLGKHNEYAITEVFHDASTVGITDLADPVSQARNGAGSFFITQ